VDENMKHDQNDPALRANTENGTSVEVKNDPIKNQINTRQYAATIFYSPKLLFDKVHFVNFGLDKLLSSILAFLRRCELFTFHVSFVE
jgi:HKD family nuclease